MSLKERFRIDHLRMVIDMNDAKLVTIEQLRSWLAATAEVGLTPLAGAQQCYEFLDQVLRRFGYAGQGKEAKGLIRSYLLRMTGYSRSQITRLITRQLAGTRLTRRSTANRSSFGRKFSPADVRLLAHTDRLHGTLSGPATKVLLERAWRLDGDTRYTRLAAISVSHLYNLRAQPLYQNQRRHFVATTSRPSRIGIRRAPAPQGQPGFIRIDTVHQGDQDGVKGLYHVNAVDIVTQWQLVATCERISEAYLLPVIELLLAQFPFVVRGFHSDGGSEYVNHDVASLLDKLRIEFTRSRPRHTNDNALVESKNGAVIRKHFGYAHISQRFAGPMNTFCQNFLNPYLNFHRPCFFPVDEVDAKGKIKKRYPHDQIMTPYDRLTSLDLPGSTMRDGITFATLHAQSRLMTDNEAAAALTAASSKLFQSINRRSKAAA
jgi:transposase InsO family protein